MSSTPDIWYRRSPAADVERSGDEIILLHSETLEFRVLNASGAVLWDAIDEFGSVELLTGLLAEAGPDISIETHREQVMKFVQELATGGFLLPV